MARQTRTASRARQSRHGAVGLADRAHRGRDQRDNVDGDRVGELAFEGPGAGAGRDGLGGCRRYRRHRARQSRSMPFIVPSAKLKPSQPAPMARHIGMYYVRLKVMDKAGVLRPSPRCSRKPRSLDREPHSARPRAGRGRVHRDDNARMLRGNDARRTRRNRRPRRGDGQIATSSASKRFSRYGLNEAVIPDLFGGSRLIEAL